MTAHPLSPCQRRIWFLDQLSPGSFANNVVVAYDVSGELDVERLALAVRQATTRHDVLRTRFSIADGQPVQIVPDEASAPEALCVRDVAGGIDEAVLAESQRLLDLESGPPFRITLLRRRGETSVLLINLHHIISDGNHSAALLAREIVARYAEAASRKGTALPLPALPLRYKDFASWQSARCRGPEFEGRLEAYSKAIGDAPTVLDLPFSAARPPEQTFVGRSVWRSLPGALAASAREAGRRAGGSLLTVLTATFQILLHLYTRQSTVLVAVPVSGRDLEGTEGMVGYFGNPVVHRLDIDPEARFQDLLRLAAERMELSKTYRDVPFDDLVRRLDPARDAARSPLFQLLVELQAELPHLSAPGATFTPRPIDTGIAPYDLLLSVTEGPDQVLARFDYNDRLFDAATVERVAGHFLSLLEAAVTRPEARPREVCLPGEAELSTLRAFGTRPLPGTDLPCAHSVFEARAREIGDATAIELEGAKLSYRALNERANRIARCLVARGAGPEKIVGILMDRSIDAVATLVAICKTGGAFVALDPDLPAERLRFFLEDSQVSTVVADEALLDRLSGHSVDVLCLDRERALVAAQDGADLGRDVRPESLAYLIYTSGSTGRPKAIAMPHACLSNLVAWQARDPRLSARARTLQFAPFHFDIAYQELFTTWDAGGTLVLVPQAVRRDAEALLAYLAAHRVERLYLPYAALENLARVFRPESDHGLCLREIITAGEQLVTTPALVRLLDALPENRLYNQYGPSECHVVTVHELSGPPSTWPVQPPIGHPIDGTQIHLVNEALVPVPLGVPGEVLLGGAGLCRGYLGRPALTAEKIIADPFTDAPGARLYRTGDLARYLPDGALQFLGRIDDQVKIRGFRVEPGEVEALLRDHPSVLQALVLAEKSPGGQARLMAYVVPNPGVDRAGLAGRLRVHLEHKLPEYMIPSALLVIDEIPLKVTGKIDRAALGKLGEAAAAAVVEERPHEPPATPTQAAVAEIWSAVLGIPRIGANDHFFALGGHSLLATQVVSAVRTSMGVAVPLAAVFQLPTLASFAARLEAMLRERSPGAAAAPAAGRSPDVAASAGGPATDGVRSDWETGEL